MSAETLQEQSWSQSIILCGTNSNVLALRFLKGQHSYVTSFIGKGCERSDAACDDTLRIQEKEVSLYYGLCATQIPEMEGFSETVTRSAT